MSTAMSRILRPATGLAPPGIALQGFVSWSSVKLWDVAEEGKSPLICCSCSAYATQLSSQGWGLNAVMGHGEGGRNAALLPRAELWREAILQPHASLSPLFENSFNSVMEKACGSSCVGVWSMNTGEMEKIAPFSHPVTR